MISMLLHINQMANRNASKLFLLGIAAVAVYNWRLWQRDKALATRLLAEHPPAPKLARTPKVSALVAAWNERDRIEAHIHSFLALSYPEIELILCAGGTDGTLERARRYAGERVIVLEQQPGEGKQHALARCLERASGEVIYLTDADCVYVNEALTRLLAPLINEGEQVTSGGSRPLDEQAGKLLPSYMWAVDVVSEARRPAYFVGLYGRNAALTRCAIDQIGGLDFPARTGTDYHLAQRLNAVGLAIRHVGTSVVPSEYPETLGHYRRQRSRWLRNLLLYGPQYGAHRDVWATLKTVVTGAGMLIAPLVAVAGAHVVLLPWLLLLAHAMGAKLRYALFAARLYQRPVAPGLLVALAPLTLIDFAIWALPIFDLLHPERRKRW
jgi:cellulose synthase/poly-beta-1,6-N-acetylglucosamine synthase-like glycosyltransferase